MSIKPLYDRVLIKRFEEEEKTAGGIIIPDTAKEKPTKGKIVATGAGTRTESGQIVPLTVKAGDIVLFAKWGGQEIKVNGEELIILKESDIIAIEEAA
jgi:chaperonin GroES